MKQVVQNFRNGTLKIDEVPPPVVTDGFVLVANYCSLISAGTEKSTILVAQKSLIGKAADRPDLVKKVLNKVKKDGWVDTFKMVFDRLDTPAALGYSCSGVVLESLDGRREFSAGDKVACAGQNYASHAGIVSVPKNLCVKIPDGVDFQDASFVALGAIALQGIRQAEPRLGDRVAVLGLGLLGQLTVQMLKASGCQVLASDLDPNRLDLAKHSGADRVVLPSELEEAARFFSQGYGVDSVIITAGSKENDLVEIAGEISRKKGRVVIVGAVGMNIPREPYYKKELELCLSASYGPGRYDIEYEEKGNDYPIGYVRWTEKRNMEAFLMLIQQRRINLKPLVTHQFPIDLADRAYRLLADGEEPYLGILLSYPEPGTEGSDQKIIRTHSPAAVKRINLGIIGAGNHVNDMLLPQLTELHDVGIHSVCTGSGIHAKSVAEKVNASICTTDYRQILQDEAIHAVIIGTRHHLHGAMVVEALQSNKHVFVEKPLCLTEEELEKISSIYREKSPFGYQLAVGFNRRFSAHTEKATEFFKGRQNPLVMVYRVNAGELPATHWSQDPQVGGGRILGEACHFIDFMHYFCQARPVTVQARRIGFCSSGITDDQSVVMITFEDGSVGTVLYTAGGDTALPKERFEAFGDKKVAVIHDFTLTELYSGGRKKLFKTGKRDKGFKGEMTGFIQAIQNGKPFMDFEGIRSVTRATILGAKSMQTGMVCEI